MPDRSTMLLVARAEAKERERSAAAVTGRHSRVAEGKGDANTVRAQLSAIVDELGAEEVRVVALLARRLLDGQYVYGRLDLANDPRDLQAERGDELADALIYGAMAELQRILRKGAG